MGKKKSRTSQTSKGVVGNAFKSSTKELKKEYKNSLLRDNNQLKAFYKGKRVMLTVPNPNTNETNKPFIKVNARDIWTGGGKEKKR